MWRRFRAAHLLRGVVAIALLASGLAMAQQVDRYYMEMRDRFYAAAIILTGAGFQISHEPYVQTLGHQRYRDFTVYLRGGMQYAVFAVGDDDARDIDLEIYDDQGRLIARDESVDREALVGVQTRYSATHTVRLIMRSCRSTTCYAGAGVFVRQR
jgi:hypothetical protein